MGVSATITGVRVGLGASPVQVALPLKSAFLDQVPQGEVIHFVLSDRSADGHVANDRGPLDYMICVSEVGQ